MKKSMAKQNKLDRKLRKSMLEEKFRAEAAKTGEMSYLSSQHTPSADPFKNLDVGFKNYGKASAQPKSQEVRKKGNTIYFGSEQAFPSDPNMIKPVKLNKTEKSPAPQLAPIDPVTGMPMQPQMTPQPNTVGMPGTMPMPAGMGHTLPEHGMQAGGRKMSPYMQKKKTSVAGQDISESGHMNVNYKDGPKEGDLIRGPHLKYDNVGLPKDFDYKVKFEKDTVDQHGPYKIYKTTGIK